MKNKIMLTVVISLLLNSHLIAKDNNPKAILKTNYKVVYSKKPKSVDTLESWLKEGEMYGRLRTNNFYYRWESESAKQQTHLANGVGLSLIYQTPKLYGFDMRVGLYGSKAEFDNSDASLLKSGKGLLSRFDYTNSGSSSMGIIGEAYLRYSRIDSTQIILGRQIVETFYTASNDSKMIPNIFEGLYLSTKAIPKSTINLAYLTKEKLRDHTQTHNVLVYGDSSSSSSLKPSWSQNDDSAMHKGLTYTRLKNAGVDTDTPLIVGDFKNKSIDNLSLGFSFYSVPDLVSEVMAEVNYDFKIGDFTISPAMRYISQIDGGAGKIGGASYSGKLAGQTGSVGGYKDASSLNSQMIALRLVGNYQNYKLNLGYSQVFDEADLITPWRAFPTAGYTRSMARYNWMANTKSYRALLKINSNQKGIYEDMVIELSALHTDADETKGYFDEDYYYVGFVQNIPEWDNIQWRLRVGYNDTKKVDADNLDARFELNYLF